MKILFVQDSPMSWQSGIWFHRTHLPTMGLQKRGHDVQAVALGGQLDEKLINWPDTVIFGRTYHPNLDPLSKMQMFKNAGARVLYDIDDDLWAVNPENPSVLVSNAFKDQYESLIKECDAVITPSPQLKKKIQKFVKNKPVHICPNSVHKQYYQDRAGNDGVLNIGYAGAASHWRDLDLIVEPILDLAKKYDFTFTLMGIVGGPISSEMYAYQRILASGLQPEKKAYMESAFNWYKKMATLGNRFVHIPFHMPEQYPWALRASNIDIGLAPLVDNEFNSGKSNIKYYEYAGVGTVTLASKVAPYNEEVNYLSKNTYKDWYKKLEKLIVDEQFRKDLLKKQQDWVWGTHDVSITALDWEKAAQLPGGLSVANQNENLDK